MRSTLKVGDQFGKLTVISRSGKNYRGRTLWRCDCACGGTRSTTADMLTSGRASKCVSCGHTTTFRDLAGARFGRWTAMTPTLSRKPGTRWLCRCECGVEKTVLSTNLIQGYSQSCGCLQRELLAQTRWTGCGELSGSRWSHVIAHARSRHLHIDITIKQAWDLFLQQGRSCAMTGLPLCFGQNQTASLDRIDSSRGYVIGNLQWVHKTINLMRGTCTVPEFVAWCNKVSDHAYRKHETFVAY